MRKLSLLILFSLFASITYTMNDAAAVDEVTAPINAKLTKLRNLHGDHNWPHRKALIMQLIEDNPANVDVVGYNCETPLHESIIQADVSFAQYLLQHDADVNKKNSANETPLFKNIRCINLNIQGEITRRKQLVSLLIAYSAHPDQKLKYQHYTARSLATPETQVLIEQAEQKKAIKEYLLYSLIVKYMPNDPSSIVISYLDKRSPHFTPEYIANIEAKVTKEDRLLLQQANCTKIEEIASIKVKISSVLFSTIKNMFSWLHNR